MDTFIVKLFPGIGGDVSKSADFYKPAPKVIYVVATERSYRQYTAEGHALNWFAKQVELNRNPVLIKYFPEAKNN
jgi:hypothetical protein